MITLHAEAGLFTLTGMEVTLKVRVNLAVQQLRAAARFSKKVAEVEQLPDLSFEHHWEELLHYSIASVLSCAASLEAYANELFNDRATVFPDIPGEALDELWPVYERMSPLHKFQFVLGLKRVPKFDEGAKAYQDVRALGKLRDALMHFKPEWTDEPGEHEKISKTLLGRFAPGQLVSDTLLFPRRWACSGCTIWAVNSVLNFATEFEEKLGLATKYQKIDL